MKKITLLKRIVLICLVLLFVMPITGCKKQPSKAEQAVAYMNAKYDDEFTFKYYAAGDSKSVAAVQSQKFPNAQEIQVRGNRRDDGTYEFWDNYVYFKYEEETKTFYKDFFEEVFQCEVTIRYSLRGIGNGLYKDFTNEMTFEEFIHNHKVFIELSVSDEKFCCKDKAEIENLIKSAIIDNNLILSTNLSVHGQGTLVIGMIEHEEFVIFRWEK